MYMCSLYGKKAIIITERKIAFRQVASGIRLRTNIGESASAGKVLNI